MSKIITTFDQVEIPQDKTTLVLCDIDDTVLRYPMLLQDFYKKEQAAAEFIFMSVTSKKEKQIYINEYINDEYYIYRTKTDPIHTDIDGFNNMIQKIYSNGGELKFVTSRSIVFNEQTRKHLQTIGIDPELYKIHYTFESGVKKSRYIQENINKEQYQNIIFIDDREDELKLVRNDHPDITTYRFTII
jgi:predicted secreted acid phosphatase